MIALFKYIARQSVTSKLKNGANTVPRFIPFGIAITLSKPLPVLDSFTVDEDNFILMNCVNLQP